MVLKNNPLGEIDDLALKKTTSSHNYNLFFFVMAYPSGVCT